jgi:hypothetical protein
LACDLLVPYHDLLFLHQISENSRSRSPSSESPPISDAQDIPVVRGEGNGRSGLGDRYVRRPRGRTVSRPRGGDRKEEIVVGHEEVAGQGK